VAELEAVLRALGASAGQRALVFAHIEAPRALRHLRQAGLHLRHAHPTRLPEP
jgi:hypothetical protein